MTKPKKKLPKLPPAKPIEPMYHKEHWEVVDCPTCENGKRFSPKRCPLCEGKGRIKALK